MKVSLVAQTLITCSKTPASSTFAKSIRIRSIGPTDDLRKKEKSDSACRFCQITSTQWIFSLSPWLLSPTSSAPALAEVSWVAIVISKEVLDNMGDMS